MYIYVYTFVSIVDWELWPRRGRTGSTTHFQLPGWTILALSFDFSFSKMDLKAIVPTVVICYIPSQNLTYNECVLNIVITIKRANENGMVKRIKHYFKEILLTTSDLANLKNLFCSKRYYTIIICWSGRRKSERESPNLVASEKERLSGGTRESQQYLMAFPGGLNVGPEGKYWAESYLTDQESFWGGDSGAECWKKRMNEDWVTAVLGLPSLILTVSSVADI